MKQILISTIILLSLASCAKHQNGAGDGTNGCADITGYDNPVKSNGDGLNAKIAKTVKLETTEDNLLNGLSKVVVVRDSIIVLSDQESVQSYGSDGHFRCKYGSKGNGAGDYINLSGFYVNDNDEIVIIDSYRSCLLRYDLDGNFVGKDDVTRPILECARAGVGMKDGKVFINEYISQSDNPLYIVYDTATGKVTDEMTCLLRTSGVRYPIGKSPMCEFDGHVLALMPLSQYIYSCDGRQVYRFVTEKAVVTDQQMAEMKDYSFMTFADIYSKGMFPGFSDIFETDTHIFCMNSNLAYTVVDKKSLTCQNYKYTSGSEVPAENINPLVNIVGCSGKYLIGNLFYESMMSRSELNEELMKRWDCQTSEDDNPVLVFYEIV